MSRDDELYGPLWDAGRIERAALDTIEEWEETHLAAKERVEGLTVRALPKAKRKIAGGVFDWQPANQLPLLLLVVGDTEPGDGGRNGTLDLEVTVVVEDKDLAAARHLARRLAAAYASCLLAHPVLDGQAARIAWDRDDSELVQQGDRQGRRVAAAARVLAVSFNAGPPGRGAATPPVLPYEPSSAGPIATDVNLHLTTEPGDTEP